MSLSQLTDILSQAYDRLPSDSTHKQLILDISALAASAKTRGDRASLSHAKKEAINVIDYLQNQPLEVG